MTKMINDIEAFRECGRKAAIAVNEGDWPRHNSWRDHANRMIAFEAPGNRTTARNAFAHAYSEARHVTFARGR